MFGIVVEAGRETASRWARGEVVTMFPLEAGPFMLERRDLRSEGASVAIPICELGTNPLWLFFIYLKYEAGLVAKTSACRDRGR